MSIELILAITGLLLSSFCLTMVAIGRHIQSQYKKEEQNEQDENI